MCVGLWPLPGRPAPADALHPPLSRPPHPPPPPLGLAPPTRCLWLLLLCRPFLLRCPGTARQCPPCQGRAATQNLPPTPTLVHPRITGLCYWGPGAWHLSCRESRCHWARQGAAGAWGPPGQPSPHTQPRLGALFAGADVHQGTLLGLSLPASQMCLLFWSGAAWCSGQGSSGVSPEARLGPWAMCVLGCKPPSGGGRNMGSGGRGLTAGRQAPHCSLSTISLPQVSL